MATGSARVSIASSSESREEPEPREFGESNPAFRQSLEKALDQAYRAGPEPVLLDSDDPIDSILAEMRALMRDKAADYAVDGNPLSNFFRTAEIMQAKGRKDFTALDSVEHLLAVKQARLEALTANGRTEETKNESVRDTMIDDANYAVLKLAIYTLMQEHKASEAI